MPPASRGLAFAAGGLSTLSPCVLPLIPVVLGTAASEHRWGPVALAAGLALSFTAIGLFVATVGFSIGVEADVFRTIAAVLLIALGAILLSPTLQEHFAIAAGPAGNWMSSRLGASSQSGLRGQFAVGLLLGAVWSPCTGPTLGAATLLAAQGQNLASAAATMAMFGLGAALPLLLLGSLSREAMMRLRSRLTPAGRGVRRALGIVLILVGLGIVSGYDKRIEALLVNISPDWLTRITTSI